MAEERKSWELRHRSNCTLHSTTPLYSSCGCFLSVSMDRLIRDAHRRSVTIVQLLPRETRT